VWQGKGEYDERRLKRNPSFDRSRFGSYVIEVVQEGCRAYSRVEVKKAGRRNVE
jgi:hypothetical protein